MAGLNPFTTHPRTLGMSWWSHGIGAAAIGFRMIAAGVACVIHAIVPAWFTDTAGRTVVSLHEHMTARRAARPDWPDYEI